VLVTPGHDNKVYDITGPEAVGVREIAAAASAVSGKKIEIVEGDAAPRQIAGPAASKVSTDVMSLTGHPPKSVKELLKEKLK
jgi:uncharacterized protein YbjT (DUF2867 family)